MKNYKDVQKSVPELVSLTCDVCGTVYSDLMEMQEFQSIDFVGGYASVFGDSVQVQCDICQYCLHDMVHNYVKTEEI